MLSPHLSESGMSQREWQSQSTEPWQGYLGAAIFVPLVAIAAFWAINALFWLARAQYAAPSAVIYFVVPALTFGIAILAYYLREVMRTVAYPIIEVGVGLAASAQAVPATASDLARIVAVLAGVRIMVDGIMRFRKFSQPTSNP